jgi:hypothetical protein
MPAKKNQRKERVKDHVARLLCPKCEPLEDTPDLRRRLAALPITSPRKTQISAA